MENCKFTGGESPWRKLPRTESITVLDMIKRRPDSIFGKSLTEILSEQRDIADGLEIPVVVHQSLSFLKVHGITVRPLIIVVGNRWAGVNCKSIFRLRGPKEEIRALQNCMDNGRDSW